MPHRSGLRIPTLAVPRFRRPPPLPPDFFLGVATSDHQCEAYDPRWEDVRDQWEKLDGRTPRGRATDFWNRHAEDIALARDLGCRAFRFSVAWTRVEPEPGRYDAEVLAHYRRLVERIREAGMIPILTLHHFTWPPHVEARGGMTAPAFPDTFADYAEKVAEALGDLVGYWLTFNEPTYLPMGYIKRWGSRSYLMPPGLGKASSDEQVRAAAFLMRNLFLAHREARLRIRARHPEAKVGTNPFVLGFPTGLQAWLDHHACAQRDPETWAKRERRSIEGYPDLVAGVVDVMFGAFTRTPEREAQMLFSEGYADSRPALLVAAADPARAPGDLEGARTAAVRGSSAAAAAPRSGVGLRLRWARSLEQGVKRLAAGQVRAVLGDDHLLEQFGGREPGVWRLVPLDVPEQPYAAAVALNRESLLQEVDAAIHEVLAARGQPAVAAEARLAGVGAVPRGAEAVAADRLAAVDAAPPPPASARETWRSGDPVAAVRRRGEIVVGLRRGGSPFAWRDPETREWHGLEVDIARALAKRVFGDPARVRFLAIDPILRTSAVRSFWLWPFEFAQRVLALFSTVANSDWWNLGMAGRLPTYLCPAECAGQLDFVGFDYYWGVQEMRWDRIRGLLDSINFRFATAPVHPGGLRRLLTRYARMFPDKEIVIFENGCIDRADGMSREEYLRAHLWEVQKAVAAGVPVKGYVCWSITSNREWGLPFGPESDFGLYHIDLDRDPELKRVPTAASEAFREIARSGEAAPTESEALREWMRKLGLRRKGKGRGK
jgi:beta-glucosidase/6-phospho-beta-glucosidase/beta-galactosidase/ABC-type amino acid transport substrate-binding protein